MSLIREHDQAILRHQTRRCFLRDGMTGLGGLWLGSQLAGAAEASGGGPVIDSAAPFAPRPTHFSAKVKRVIYLHMAGAPSQLELFDHKPELDKLNGKDCPQEFLKGQRFAFIRGTPQLLGSYYPFHQTGQAGHWISDRLPHFEKLIDKVCFIRTMQTDQFNHAPAQLLLHTGNARLGYASIGSWATYGLGSENQNLPGYVALVSGGKTPSAGKSAWGSGFLPSVYQGVQCRSQGDPVLFLSNPNGIDNALRGKMVDTISQINQQTYNQVGDPETVTRIAQYEMAYRMQMAASDAMSLEQETANTHAEYGVKLGAESFANNCLLARRLVERGVRYVQLFDWGWDTHGADAKASIDQGFKTKCREIDRPIAALLTDLQQRGLWDETLVIWSGEFGRTPMRENRGGQEMKHVGRDHHAKAFTLWMAGGGVKQGYSHGETDPIGFGPVTPPVEVRDFHATLLHLMGLDHRKLTYPFQGLDQKLTGVKPAQVIREVLA